MYGERPGGRLSRRDFQKCSEQSLPSAQERKGFIPLQIQAKQTGLFAHLPLKKPQSTSSSHQRRPPDPESRRVLAAEPQRLRAGARSPSPAVETGLRHLPARTRPTDRQPNPAVRHGGAAVLQEAGHGPHGARKRALLYSAQKLSDPAVTVSRAGGTRQAGSTPPGPRPHRAACTPGAGSHGPFNTACRCRMLS